MNKKLWLGFGVAFLLLLTSWQAQAKSTTIPAFTNWQNTLQVPLIHSQSQSESLAANARVAWDAQFLYLTVFVQDNSVGPKHSVLRDFGDRDHVSIYLDAQGNGKSQGRTKPSVTDYIFIVSPKNVFGDPMLTSFAYGGHEHLRLNLRSINYSVAVNDHGYVVEIYLPWSLLGVTPKEGDMIGLALVVRDVDQRGLLGEVSSVRANPHFRPSGWQQFRLQ